ncbi:MAG: zinc-ribbon domain-containing protein [Candidatus Hodarchaeales archaeon]
MGIKDINKHYQLPTFSAGILGVIIGYSSYLILLLLLQIPTYAFVLALIAGIVSYVIKNNNDQISQKKEFQRLKLKSPEFDAPIRTYRQPNEHAQWVFVLSMVGFILLAFTFFQDRFLSNIVSETITWCIIAFFPSSAITLTSFMKTSYDNQRRELIQHRDWLYKLTKELNGKDEVITPIEEEIKPSPPSISTIDTENHAIERKSDAKPIYSSKPIIKEEKKIVPPKVVHCTSCGSKISEEIKFCTNCGTPIIKRGKLPGQPVTISAKKPLASVPETPKQYETPHFQQVDGTQEIKRTEISFLEQFSNYILLGGFLFVFITIMAWIFVIFPDTTNLEVGQQNWIAGDTIFILGITLILIAELVISGIKYKFDKINTIPIDYFIMGIGFSIGLIGLAIMRFQTLTDFLPTLGILDSYWLIVGSGILLGLLAWIYAWRTPYKDFLFVLYASAFLIIDYSLNVPFGTDWVLILPFVFGFLLLWVPGLFAIFQQSSDARFIVTGLITQSLLLFRIENAQSLIDFEPLAFSIIVIIPALLISFVIVTRKIKPLWEILLGVSGVLPLLALEIIYLNTYIDIFYYAIAVIGIFTFLTVPVLIKKNKLFNEFMIGITGIFINTHGLLFLFNQVSADVAYLSLIPLLVAVINLMKLPSQRDLSRIVGYIWVIIGLGAFISLNGWILVIYGFSIILGLQEAYFKRSNFRWGFIIYFVGGLPIFALSSFLTFLDLWEVLSTPVVFIIIIFLFYTKRIPQDVTILIVSWLIALITINILIMSHPVYSNYLLLEYIVFLIIAFVYYWINPIIRHETHSLLWLVPIIGLLATTLLSEYNSWIFGTLFASCIILTFITIVYSLQEQPVKQERQFSFDTTIIILNFGLFAYLLLEPFDELIFLSLFFLILILDIILIWFSIQYSGLDLTYPIIMPCLLFISKELLVTQFWLLDVTIEYSFSGFIIVIIHSIVVAWFSKRTDEAQIPLISPLVAAFFSNELILLILFFNQVFTDYLGLFSFLFVLFIGIVTLIPTRNRITHIEFSILQITTALLSLSLVFEDTLPQEIFSLIPLFLPIFWLLQRFKVKNSLYPFDTVVFTLITIVIFLWSLKLDQIMFLVGGLALLLLSICGTIFLWRDRNNIYKSTKLLENYFYTALWSQIPFWGIIILGFDILTGANILWSVYSEESLEGTFWVWILVTLIVIIHFILWFTCEYQMTSILSLVYSSAIFLEITLSFLSFQLIYSSITEDPILNGVGMIVSGSFLVILASYKIIQNEKIISFNIILITASLWLLIYSLFYLISSGLLPAYWAVIGTMLVLIGLFKPKIREQIGLGTVFLVCSILKVIFDFVTNFDVLSVEIALSSSILACSLLFIAYTINLQLKKQLNQKN